MSLKGIHFSRRQLLTKLAVFSGGTCLLPGWFTKAYGHHDINSNAAGKLGQYSGIKADFLDDNFLLHSKTAEILYHDYAKGMPIIDYHCHLPPIEIASNKQFDNLTQIWIDGDHYKMRAMRANGVAEKYITGDAPDAEKFVKWAETIPYAIRSPLYHWTHLELKRYFGINQILNSDSASEIYNSASQLLRTDQYRVQNLIKNKKVELLCTTDDPADDLNFHQEIKRQGYGVTVLPAWRPDKVLAMDNVVTFNTYLDKLSVAANITISKYSDLVDALKNRQKLFHFHGCKVSDHGVEAFYAEDFTETEIAKIFAKARAGNQVSFSDLKKYKCALLLQLAEMNHDFGWVQQFHVGPIRNTNKKMFNLLGPDKGYDSIGDKQIGSGMAFFFDQLEQRKKLSKSIVYNVNPRDNEMMATMVGNYNDGSIPGKMQYGAAWWFLDQKDGIERQLNALSNMGLLGRFVGMTTDSRSFLSYPRHEYFRRVLCNLIATDVEKHELPSDMKLLGKVVKDICYYNAKEYFKFTT
jgi:glucuronate isomerase